jgi:hypothetical protein
VKRRHRTIAAASAVAAALLTASGCGVQSTSINTFSAAVAAPTSSASSGAPTTTTGKYVYWVYLLESGNIPVPVQRTSDVQPTMQSVVSSLVQQPTEQGYLNDLTTYPDLTITARADVGQLYALSVPFGALTSPARWQLVCTVWQFAQTIHPANAPYGLSVSFNVKTPNTGWHDCSEYTNYFPPGTKVPPQQTSAQKLNVPYPSSVATAPGISSGTPTDASGG